MDEVGRLRAGTPATLRLARELGIIDRAGINPAHEVGDADLVLVATPVAQMPENLRAHRAYPRKCRKPMAKHQRMSFAARAAFKRANCPSLFQRIPFPQKISGPSAASLPICIKARKWWLLHCRKIVTMARSYKTSVAHCSTDIYELTPETHDRFSPQSAICRILLLFRLGFIVWQDVMI